MDIDLADARRLHLASAAALAGARQAERRMIEDAARARVALPEHYWQERWRMENRHRALGAFIEAMEESA